MLSYGIASDLVDKYMRMSELTCVESMHKFCRVIIEVFGEVKGHRCRLEGGGGGE
jgi:hypothetical protein